MIVSIVIPVFNEEDTIQKTLQRVERLSTKGVTYEVVVVDDGSTDTTVDILKSLSKIRFTYTLKTYFHKKNLGKGRAVQTGITHARGRYILIQDADLEYHPKFIPRLLLPVLDGDAEVVYGTRLNRLPHLRSEEKRVRFLVHYLGNRFLSLITSILFGVWLTDIETGYKVFPKAALQKFTLESKGFEFEPEITIKLLKAGYKIREIPITTVPRGYEKGKKLSTFRDGRRALLTLLRYRFFR